MHTTSRHLINAVVSGFVLVVCSPDVSAQFEGIVETTNLTTDELGELREFVMTMWIKDAMVKVTHSPIGATPATTLVYRNDLRERWILNDEAKTYLSIPQDSISESLESPGPQEATDPHTIKMTHKTKRILGYSAEQIIVRQGEQTTEIWGTKKLPHLARAISRVFGSGENAGGWTQELMRMGLFTLVSTTRLHGRIAESQTVTRIESRELLHGLFEVPAGYRRETTREMIRRLGQGTRE